MSDYQHAPATRRILESLVPVVCPPDAMTLGLGADIVDHVALTMGVLPRPFRVGMILGLRTYDLGALVFPPGRGTLAHRLSPALAERYYDSWLHGPTPIHRQLALAVGQLLKLGHYEQPAAQAKLGYTPTAWIERVTRRRLEVYSDDIKRHAQSLIEPDPLPGIAPYGGRASKREVA